MRLLRIQAAVRVHLGAILDGRRADGNSQVEGSDREGTPPPQSQDSARQQSAVYGLTRAFADPNKAQDLLGKLL